MSELHQTAKAVFRAYWLPEVLAAVATVLIVASFIVPPTGVIDPSVLAGTGELSLISAMFSGIILIENGRKVRISKGDMTISTNEDGPGPAEDMHYEDM